MSCPWHRLKASLYVIGARASRRRISIDVAVFVDRAAARSLRERHASKEEMSGQNYRKNANDRCLLTKLNGFAEVRTSWKERIPSRQQLQRHRMNELYLGKCQTAVFPRQGEATKKRCRTPVPSACRQRRFHKRANSSRQAPSRKKKKKVAIQARGGPRDSIQDGGG